MSVTETPEPSLRPGRFEYKRLAWAFAISLAVHLFCYGGYQFSRTVLPGLLERMKILAALAHALQKPPPASPSQPSEPPLVFLDVNPEAATPLPPKNAKYYSAHNSQAANREADADKDIPKISGQQEHVAKTEDAPRKNDGLHPSAAPAKESQEAQQAKPKPQIGDLAMAKPETALQPDTGTAEQTRPRTLTEARMRQQNNMMPGQAMKQEGGMRRRLEISSLDAKETPFGAYDAAFIEAVQQEWYNLLDESGHELDRHGRVVVQFHLNYDGSISDMKVVDNTADDSLNGTMGIICEEAVTHPQPYQAWPREMRLEIDKDYREIQFTFFYD
jgi:hypothetical protein